MRALGFGNFLDKIPPLQPAFLARFFFFFFSILFLILGVLALRDQCSCSSYIKDW